MFDFQVVSNFSNWIISNFFIFYIHFPITCHSKSSWILQWSNVLEESTFIELFTHEHNEFLKVLKEIDSKQVLDTQNNRNYFEYFETRIIFESNIVLLELSLQFNGFKGTILKKKSLKKSWNWATDCGPQSSKINVLENRTCVLGVFNVQIKALLSTQYSSFLRLSLLK